MPNSSSASLAPKSSVIPTFKPSTKTEKQDPTQVVELESEEVEEVEQLKRKNREKDKKAAN